MLRSRRWLARTLTAMTRSRTLASRWLAGVIGPSSAAAATRPSSRPNRSNRARPNVSTSSPWVTSSATSVASLPWRRDRVVDLLEAAARAGDEHQLAHPAAAQASATAAPSPREAPVISTTRPSSRPALRPHVQASSSIRLSCPPPRSPSRSVRRVGIFPGEAGVAILRQRPVAARLADRAVQPVDGQECQAVDADDPRHLLERVSWPP